MEETIVTTENEVENKTSVEDAFYQNTKPEVEVEETDIEKTEEAKPEADTSDVQEESKEAQEEKKETEIEYKLKLTENSLLDNSFMEDLESFARENNLSNDAAQQILSKQEGLLQNWVEAQLEAAETEKDSWRDLVIKDKELGGDNLKRTSELSKRAVNRFASPEFINILRESGYGDHPEVVKFMYQVGKAMNDDSLIRAESGGGLRSTEDLFYGQN